MKTKQILLTSLLAIISFFAKAQVGTVNSGKLFQAMPVFAKIDTLTELEKGKYLTDFGKKQVALQVQSVIADSLYKSDAKSAATIKAIDSAQKLKKDLDNYQQWASNKIAEYKQIMQQPYIDKIDAAIKEVATRRKLMQVIDVQQVALAYLNPAADITEDVIKIIKQR